jgi:hypothetical protein
MGRPHGFASEIHVPHMAGKAGVRGAQLSALPLLAAGAKRLVTGEDTRKLDVKSDVVRPVVEHATYQDQVKRGDKRIAKFLNESETARLDRHKKAGTLLSLTSGTLGFAALGTRAPAVARSLSGKGVKGLSRVARHEAKATSLSNSLGVTALGAGSAGSFNYAAQQKLERKRDTVSKVVYRGMSVNSAKRALTRGFKAAADGDIGSGVYTTPDLRAATSYASPQNNGNSSLRGHKGKRIGRVFTINDEGLSPIANGKPQDLGFGGYSRYDQRTFREGQITRDRIVHVQNVNRTTGVRLMRRLDPHMGGNPNAVVKGMPTYGWLKNTGEKVRVMRPHGTTGHFLVDSPRGTLIVHRDAMRYAKASQTRLTPESPRAAAARAKQPEQLTMFDKSFLSHYSDRISPNAEAGYRHLRAQRNENAASAVGNSALAGLSAGVLAHEGRSLSKPAAALTGAGGLAAAYTALNATKTAQRRHTSMKKIEQKAHARAALGLYGPDRGKTPVDMSSARAKKTGAAE